MTSCRDIKDFFTPYIDNELNEYDKARFEKHINSCKSCKEELNLLASIIACCNETEEIDLPEDFTLQLHNRLIDLNQNKSKNWLLNFDKKYIKVASSIAAGLLLIVALKGVWSGLAVPMGQKTSSLAAADKSTGQQKMDKSGALYDIAVPENRNSAASESKNPGEKSLAGSSGSTSSNYIIDGTANKEKSAENPAPSVDSNVNKNVIIAFSEAVTGQEQSMAVEQKQSSQTTAFGGQATIGIASSDRMVTTSRMDTDTRGGEEIVAASMPAPATAAFTASDNSSSAMIRNTSLTIRAVAKETANAAVSDAALKAGALRVDAGVKTKTTDLVYGAAGSSITYRVLNSQVQVFKDTLSAVLGQENIQFNETIAQDISAEINTLNHQLGDLNQKITQLEIRNTAASLPELDALKKSRTAVLSELTRLNNEISYTIIDIFIK